MRVIRLMLYFLVGLLLGASAVLARADTYTASVVSWDAGATYGKASAADACNSELARLNNGYSASGADSFSKSISTYPANDSAWCYWVLNPGGIRVGSAPSAIGHWGCPNGGTYSVINGVPTCTQKCPNGQTMNPDGSCNALPNCEAYPGSANTPSAQPSNCTCPSGSQWVPMSGCRAKCGMPAGMDVGGLGIFVANGASTGCMGGCEVQQKSGSYDIVKGGTYAPGTYTGWACKTTPAITPDNTVPDNPKLDDTKKHPPNCASGEGVLTSSSGKVSCVPAGTPNTTPPDIQKKTAVEKYPDNTTKTTETTITTDPNTNAKETVVTVTSTGGSSGTAGTTTSNTSSSGNVGNTSGKCEGDNCTDNAKPGTFGDYGTLWEKKYPDGLEKVIKDKVADMKNTSLFRLANDLAPQGIGNSGTCPAWTFNANIGPKMNFGSGSYAPPCWLWTALRAVFLVTSLLLARRLIFGG